MLTWDIENIIGSLVEELLPRFSEDKGIIITLGFNLSCFEEGNSFDERKILKLLFLRPSNYTKVFSQIEDFRGNVITPWTFKCDHDSCWRTDGLTDIFKLSMDMKDGKRGGELSISSPTFGKFVQFVTAKTKKDGYYSYTLEELTLIKH